MLILIEGPHRTFGPGELLSAECRIESLSLSEPRAMEVSVLWHTEGKGEEDLAVHYFNRVSSDEGTLDLRRAYRFQTRLPNSPMSYEGLILKIRWCVRVRLFLARGANLSPNKPSDWATCRRPWLPLRLHEPA